MRITTVLTASLGLCIGPMAWADNDKGGTPSGIPFTLPKTALRADFVLTKTESTPGHYCEYRPLFMPALSEKVKCFDSYGKKAESSTSVVLKSFGLTGVAVPDPSKRYYLPMEGAGWAIDRSSGIELSERGILNSIANERKDRRFEVVMSIIGTALGFVTRAVGATALYESCEAVEKKSLTGEKLSDPEGVVLKKCQDLENTPDGKFEKWLKDPLLVQQFRALDEPARRKLRSDFANNRLPLELAKQAFTAIQELSAELNDLLGGGGTVAAPTLIPELRAEIKARIDAAFGGRRDSTDWTPAFQFDPSMFTKAQPAVELFKMGSCGATVTDAKLLIANPLPADFGCTKEQPNQPVSIQTEDNGQEEKKVTAPVEQNSIASKPSKSDKESKKSGDKNSQAATSANGCSAGQVLTGIPFNNPADALFALNINGQQSQKHPHQRVQIAQWGGPPTCLPAPKGNYKFTVAYHASGAIKSISVSGESAVKKEAIEAAGKPFAELQTAINDARKKEREQEENRVINELKAQRAILDEQVAIREACAKLGKTCEE